MSFIWFNIFEDELDDAHRAALVSTLRKRTYLRVLSNPLDMDGNMFKNNFRLTKNDFINLLQDIEPKFRRCERSSSIPNILKLACLLRFCAQGNYQNCVDNDYNLALGQSTVSIILSELKDIVQEHVCPKWIKFHYSQEEEDEAKLLFYEKTGIIGCIDGTHIKIRGPDKHLQHLYFNRKGFFSINAMIVCNHKKIIKCVNAKYPGSSHDSNMSGLQHLFEEASK